MTNKKISKREEYLAPCIPSCGKSWKTGQWGSSNNSPIMEWIQMSTINWKQVVPPDYMHQSPSRVRLCLTESQEKMRQQPSWVCAHIHLQHLGTRRERSPKRRQTATLNSSNRIFMERKLKDKPNWKNHCYNNFNLSCILQKTIDDFKKAPPYPIMFLTVVKVGNENVNSLCIGILQGFQTNQSCAKDVGSFSILF